MMTSELKNIIENITHAKMLEIKNGANLSVIKDRIAKSIRKESELNKDNIKIKSVELENLKQGGKNSTRQGSSSARQENSLIM